MSIERHERTRGPHPTRSQSPWYPSVKSRSRLSIITVFFWRAHFAGCRARGRETPTELRRETGRPGRGGAPRPAENAENLRVRELTGNGTLWRNISCRPPARCRPAYAARRARRAARRLPSGRSSVALRASGASLSAFASSSCSSRCVAARPRCVRHAPFVCAPACAPRLGTRRMTLGRAFTWITPLTVANTCGQTWHAQSLTRHPLGRPATRQITARAGSRAPRLPDQRRSDGEARAATLGGLWLGRASAAAPAASAARAARAASASLAAHHLRSLWV